MAVKKMIGNIDRHAPVIALLAGGLVQVYLTLLAIDSMYYYTIGIGLASPFVRGAALSVIGLLLATSIVTRQLRIDALLITLIIHLIVGSLAGFARHGETFAFGRQLFAALMMTMSYWLGLYLSDRVTACHQTFRITAYATAVGGFVFLFIAALFGYLGRPFTSLNGSIPILFSLDVALLQGTWWMVAGCMIVVLATNLRSGVIGASIMIGTYLAVRYFKTRTLKIVTAPLFAVVLFICSTFTIIAIEKAFPNFGIAERAERTVSVWWDTGEGVIERLTTHRLSQTLAVWHAIEESRASLLFSGFGTEYLWRYYSEYEHDWQVYTLHQTDLMTAYFLLTGGVVFAFLLTVLVLWRMWLVFYKMLPALHLGGLFVIGFGAAMFFGFQPNVPLFWILLGALSCSQKPKVLD